MKENRRAILWCVIILIVCLMILITIEFSERITTIIRKVVIFLNDSKYFTQIIIGIFTSTCVVLMMQIVSYNTNKRKIVGTIIYIVEMYIIELGEFIEDVFTHDGVEEIARGEANEITFELALSRVKEQSRIFEKSKKLVELRYNFVIDYNSFYPIRRKYKKNLDICNLLHYWTLMHCIIQKISECYKANNHAVFAIEVNPNMIYEETKDSLLILGQEDGEKIYEKLVESYEKAREQFPSKKVNTYDLKKRCL